MSQKEKWYIGKSPRSREQLAKDIVFNLLPMDGSQVQWSELRMRAEKKRISPPTLIKHLKWFVHLRMANRRVDNATYPPSVYYSRRDPLLFPMKFAEHVRLCAELDFVGDLTDKAKAGPETLKIYNEAINVNLLFMKAALPVILYASLGGKGPYTFKPRELAQEGAIDKHLNQLYEDMHSLADELLDVFLRPWIHKMLDVLSIFSSSNKGVIEEGATPALKEAMEALERYDLLLEPYRAR